LRTSAGGLLLALALAGCGSGSPTPSPTLLSRSASSSLLTLDELRTPGFTVNEPVHAVASAALAGDDAALGRALHGVSLRDAATERFFRDVPELATANGPLDVRSTVLRCDATAGGHGAYAALVAHTDAVAGILAESAGALGDEAHADELRSTSPAGVPLVEVTLTWRVANVVAVLVVRGREGGTGLPDALILAHAQVAGWR
jgi:hypothetical protein